MCDVTNAKDIVEELLQVKLMQLFFLLLLLLFMFLSSLKLCGCCLYFLWASQYLNTAEFTMREELSLKAAILAEKFAPDLSW